ncbi:hypothetical protein SB759_31995, partial [Pseudomonas sp. SIMBA_059]
LVAVHVFQPGVGMNIDPTTLSTAGLSQYTASAAKLGVVDFFMHIIPDTFMGAFNKGEVLPVLFIAVRVARGAAYMTFTEVSASSRRSASEKPRRAN